MDILGIGGWEIAAIFLLLLVVAGPRRMIAWSYTLGKYVAVLRSMWAEAAATLQKEFQKAGVDVEIPKEPPTRASLSKLVIDTVTKASAPVTEPIKEVQLSAKDLMGPLTPRTLNKSVTQQPASPTAPQNGASSAPTPTSTDSMGAWGSTPAAPPPPDAAPPGEDSGFGAWGNGGG